MTNEILTVNGNLFVDDRGFLSFVNDFNLSDYKRFYIVENHKQDFIRAWHGHLKESKAVLCVQGAALVAAVKISNDGKILHDERPFAITLSERSPVVLKIPSGYANGFKTLTNDCKLMFFSSASLEESKNDDYRFEYNTWNIWGEKYR